METGKYSGVRFTQNSDIEEIAGEGAKRFLYTNMMYTDRATPSRQMENEIISFTKKMLHGDDETTGMTTTGGSESIFLAVLAHKRYYLRERGISKPQVVLPESAHAAFLKAFEYLDIDYKLAKCSRITGKPDLKQMRRLITSNTIMLVASSPNFPFGTVDPIEEISKMAKDHNIGIFIDGCMGSLLLPFVDDFNIETGEKYIDLRNKNVTAMTCDIHKYGNTPKGIGVLLFPNVEIKKALFFGVVDWCGGIYGTPSIQGSRASHTIAAAWSVMMHTGYEGYKENARKIFVATEYFCQEIEKMPEYYKLVGNPK